MKTLIPYASLAGEIDFEVTAAKIEGAPIPYSMISKVQRAIALHAVERERWDDATIDLRATLPELEIQDGPWSELVCVAILTEGATNTRTVRRLTRDAVTGTWNGTMPVSRASHRSRANLTVSVVATIGGVQGRLIGTAADLWVVDLEARTPARQQEIRIAEVDFRDGPEEWLRPYRDAPWLIEATGELPTVHLNTAFEGIVELLRGTGGSPMEKATRALVAGQIADEAWTAMFHSAVSDLEFDEDGSPLMPAGWRESVLRAMLPDVLPGVPLADALFEVHGRRADGHGWPALQSSIQYAAARRSQVPRSLTNTVRALGRPAGRIG